MMTTPQATLRHLTDLPGPRPWPLLGNLPQLSPARMHRQVETWAGRYGPLFAMRFASTPVLVVADHMLVADVLRERPEGFRRPSVTARVSIEMDDRPGILMAEGALWRQQRRIVMAALTPHAVKAYFPALVRTALRLQQRWRHAARNGASIELALDLKRYSMDIIAGLAFGMDINTIDSGEHALQHHMDAILTGVARRSMAPFPYWRYLKLPRERALDNSIAVLRNSVDQMIASARTRLAAEPARRQRPANLLEAMLCAAEEEGSGLDDKAVAGNVATLLLAGEDTTSSTLGWLLYLLYSNRATLQQATEEVLRLAPDPGGLTIEQLDRLDYLDACAQEALRLKPPTPFIPLEALCDSVIGDVQVPQGTLVWCVMRHDSMDEQHVPHASQFQPERWLRQDGTAIDKHVSMPFGAGPRTCSGRYLALLEIKLACAMLLASFDIDTVATEDGNAPQELMGFTMSPVGLTMRLRERAA